MIRFEATPIAIDGRAIVRLPMEASKQLPSRGQVAVHASIDGANFDTVVEPDGSFGHWLNLDSHLRRQVGTAVKLELEVADRWPEPEVPDDLATALQAAPQKIRDVWSDVTPMARWEWVRWVNATRNPDTRRRRVEVTISKISHGKRRPCCFNLASCTDPELSRNGRLVG